MQSTIFDPRHECMPRAELRRLQEERLRDVVRRAYENVPAYRGKFDAAGVRPEHIRTLDDLPKLPFTTKEDFRQAYPFGLFAVPLRDIVRVHASSGTTGKPSVTGYTRADIALWAHVIARTLGCGGGTADDVLQVAYGYGLFTGGLGLHYGGEALGALVVPMSSGNSKKQLMLLQDFGATLLACTPSYSLAMAETAAEEGLDLRRLKLRAGFFGAEPWTEGMRRQIEERWPLKALDIYGLSEVIGPGVASECLAQDGLHIFEDHFYPELVHPETGQPVGPGEQGELVFTGLTREAVPLIRYRTRDLSRLDESPCACGRTLRRMQRITGRSDDMLIIRGVNVFPSQIEEVLMRIEGTEPHYLIIVDRSGALDDMEIQVEVSEKFFSDEVRKLESFQRRITDEIRSALSISAKVTLVEPRTIERSLGKAKRVMDRRDLRPKGG